MTTELNKAVVRRFWNHFNQAAWDELAASVTPTFVHHLNERRMNWAEFHNNSQKFLQIVPDCQFTIEDIFAEGEKVVVRLSGAGTHLGPYADLPPTGASVTLFGMYIHRLADIQIAEGWGSFDLAAFCARIGRAKAAPSA